MYSAFTDSSVIAAIFFRRVPIILRISGTFRKTEIKY